jgi:hypothetical protein
LAGERSKTLQDKPTIRPISRVRRQRTGATAEFARAMARAEFGRAYVSEKDMAEVRRSLAEAERRQRGQKRK